MVNKKKKVLAIIQARYNSSRFPGKVLKQINNKSILEIIVKRLSKCRNISKIIVACSTHPNDKKITNLCKKLKINYFTGSEDDLVDRFYNASIKYNGLNVLRITADCPLIDPSVVDNIISNFLKKKYDYASNIDPPSFPDGLDAEIFTFDVLKEAYYKAKKPIEREHIRPFILNNKIFKKINIKSEKDYSFIRLTIDEFIDFKVIENIFSHFKNNILFTYKDIISLYKKKSHLFLDNMELNRNEGMYLNKGQKMWKRAKRIIPGGTMLFSKNPDLFLPNFWPAYFEKTKGCNLWDIDGKKYLDLSLMGVGTNTLGYSRKEVDDEVKKVISNGNMSTLNNKEEILLAEKLVQMHPWADKVRFARTGGEAAAIAVRIARAASGKDNVAICGYHGWHDWYLSANLSDPSNLNSHLMSNLPIQGVQKNLKNTSFAFQYNNLNQFKEVMTQKNIGVVIMEVARYDRPKKNFLEYVRKFTKENNIVLIFDECTSGFRETFGGLHLKYKINPDIATYGKALGNGYAINAIIGTNSVMSCANSSFISSTFWTERIGSVAALKTLEIMEKIKSWEIISSLGIKIKKNWKSIAKNNKIRIKIKGLDPLPRFDFDNKNNLYFKTFISQEFLKKKILAANSIYLCTDHNMKIFDNYFNILDSVFFKISKCIKDNINPKKLLDGPMCISGVREKY